MAADYGPVPISRLKGEAPKIFEALGRKRRVLISSHGRVVATIEPASVERHGAQLAEYSIGGLGDLHELSATVFNQSSPSKFIRFALQGDPVFVTRNNKVMGVLKPSETRSEVERMDVREQRMKDFESRNPRATANEFATFVKSLDDEGEDRVSSTFFIITSPAESGQFEATRVVGRKSAWARLLRGIPERNSHPQAALDKYHPGEFKEDFALSRPILNVGDTDQIIARALDRPTGPSLVSYHLKQGTKLAVVLVAGKLVRPTTVGRSLPIKKGAHIVYRDEGAVELEFKGEEILIVSPQGIVEVLD